VGCAYNGEDKGLNNAQAKRILITFQSAKLRAFDIPKFRGYLAQQYPHYSLIHNHLEDGQLRYAYPSIQFKVLNEHPTIVGIGGGISILKKVFMEINELQIGSQKTIIDEKAVVLDTVRIGVSDRPVNYRFLSPWMGLNQTNHVLYRTLAWNEKRPFLEKILRGNLKSLSKGFGYFIPNFEDITLQANLTPIVRNFKNNRMLCFKGTFTTNFLIPDYLGLGKQTARGFGTVVRTIDVKDNR